MLFPLMPRSARIDIPGILQHVIVRGIDKSDIFLDDDDRKTFVTRLVKLLELTDTDCLAWAMMSNHFHLLLRANQTKLSSFMRRLLTGHAVTFNLRHDRVGRLFQNRYKSIVCEEEPYLLELVRYIHLNPLRAGLVKDMESLDRYPWSGHAVLMGKVEFAGQQVDEILSRFGRSSTKARRNYREFIADGVPHGQRADLVGGGLKRSQPAGLAGREIEAFDERVLGCGEFVENILEETVTSVPKSPVLTLARLVERVASVYGMEQMELCRRTRTEPVAEARSALCFLATRKMGYSGAEVASALHMSRAGVSIAAGRGATLFQRGPELAGKLGLIDKITTSP